MLRICGSEIDATSEGAGSAGGSTDPATMTQQPIGQLNQGNLHNEMDTDLNGAAQQNNRTPSTSPADTARGTCALDSTINNDNDENNSWTPVNRQTTKRVKRNDRKI